MTITVTLSGLPAGVAFGHMVEDTFQELTGVTSVVDGETVWTLSEEQLVGLHMRPPENSNEDFTFSATIRTTEPNGSTKEVIEPISVDLRGVADEVHSPMAPPCNAPVGKTSLLT